ncbi:hypothetical protein BH11PLA2_BH11PLA2_07320 [soil metagenome]
MPLRNAILVAMLSLAALPGCRFFEKLSRERTPADPASRNKDKEKDKDWLRDRQDREPDSPPKDWLGGPPPAGRGNRVPAAEEAPRGVDASTASRRSVSGILEDADGRPVPNTYITVENADPAKAGFGAPLGVESDDTGYFEIRGLKANEEYMLSASITRGGQSQAGRSQVRVPRSGVRLQLREDYQLPPAKTAGNRNSGNSDGASDLPPGPGSPVNERAAPSLPASPPAVNNQEWSPLGPAKANDTPEAIRPVNPPRNDLIAPGPQPDWRSTMPPVNIPGPRAPAMPSPAMPVPGIPPLNSGPTSKAVPREARFVLLNDNGKARNFPSGQANDLVLLDFMTTYCVPCKKAIPTLTALNERYASRGVELIAVCCDSGSESKRVSLARNYKDENKLQYAVYSEAGGKDGIQERFAIEGYPTLVLIDGTGRRLWKGHPKDVAELDRILRDRLVNR